jgi:hypothetical protein
MNSVSAAVAPPPDLPPQIDHLQIVLQISIDHGVQVHLQTRSIMASKLARSRPPTALCKLVQSWPPSSHKHSLQVHLQTRSITASKFISELLDLGLQVHLQTCSIAASKFTRPTPPSASPNSPDYGLQVHR